MRYYEDMCVDCRSVGLRCLGSSCSNKRVLVIECDKCGESIRQDDVISTEEYGDLCPCCFDEQFELN